MFVKMLQSSCDLKNILQLFYSIIPDSITNFFSGKQYSEKTIFHTHTLLVYMPFNQII